MCIYYSVNILVIIKLCDKFQSYYGIHWVANSVYNADFYRKAAGSCSDSYGSIGEYVADSQYKRDLKHIDIDNDYNDAETNDSRYMR